MNFEFELARGSEGCKILMDGQDVTRYVRSVQISAGVDQVTTVQLDLLPESVIVRTLDPLVIRKLIDG